MIQGDSFDIPSTYYAEKRQTEDLIVQVETHGGLYDDEHCVVWTMVLHID